MNEKYYLDNLVGEYDRLLQTAKKLEGFGYKFTFSITTQTTDDKASDRIKLHRRLDGCILKNGFDLK